MVSPSLQAREQHRAFISLRAVIRPYKRSSTALSSCSTHSNIPSQRVLSGHFEVQPRLHHGALGRSHEPVASDLGAPRRCRAGVGGGRASRSGPITPFATGPRFRRSTAALLQQYRRQVPSDASSRLQSGDGGSLSCGTDPEVVAFYALSLLATLDPADKSYCTQYKAAGLLNWLLNEKPHHPGGLHYLIHSYDYPDLVHLALDAAETYADVAPDSTHAQHMPSHIFTRLGLWDRSIASNRDSTTSAAEYTEQAQLPGHYDEGIHSIDYLIYAHLQVAADEEARRVLDRLEELGKATRRTSRLLTLRSQPRPLRLGKASVVRSQSA